MGVEVKPFNTTQVMKTVQATFVALLIIGLIAPSLQLPRSYLVHTKDEGLKSDHDLEATEEPEAGSLLAADEEAAFRAKFEDRLAAKMKEEFEKSRGGDDYAAQGGDYFLDFQRLAEVAVTGLIQNAPAIIGALGK